MSRDESAGKLCDVAVVIRPLCKPAWCLITTFWLLRSVGVESGSRTRQSSAMLLCEMRPLSNFSGDKCSQSSAEYLSM
jgi:hypothetical protein